MDTTTITPTFITEWGIKGSGDGEFFDPWSIATDASGNVYVSDAGNDRIQKFDAGGTFITKWGSYGTGDGELNSPGGMVTDASGDVYVLDVANYRVQKFAFRPAYEWEGFFPPVENPPAFNRANAGRAIPVKFSLGGDMGLDVLATGSPTSQRIDCDSSNPVDLVEETVTAGSSSLSYDATTDTYTYVWKTDKTWAGTCRQLVVKLNDGSTEHVANFKFVK
jgi:hypothetical protein